MDGQRQKIQQRLAFMDEPKSEAPRVAQQGTEPSAVKRDTESPAREERLMEEVCERENFVKAWKQVQGNKGSPGVDGKTIDETLDDLREHWPAIREQLLRGTYQPQPVRRVEIQKPGGGVRKLGIPTVLDRLIQQAVLEVLQKRWDPTFSKHSYGFRPRRSAHQAVAQAQAYIADDCNIYVRSRRAGERVMASVCKFLTKKLRLKVNESKSAVARPDERKFLGFRLTTGAEPERLISPQALQRFQARVRELTSRTRGISIERMIGSLKPYLLGWLSYFGFSQDPLVLRNLDARIRRRLRMVIWRQWGKGPTRYVNLRRLGVPHMRAAVAAGFPTGLWAMSRHAAVQQALPNAYFDSLGLPRLSASLNA